MEFDIKKQGFWVVLGGLVVVYIVMFAVLVLPMGGATATSIKDSTKYVKEVEKTANSLKEASEVPVEERIEAYSKFEESHRQQLTEAFGYYAERDKSIELPLEDGALVEAMNNFARENTPTTVEQVKSKMSLFFTNHFNKVRDAFLEKEGAAAAVFSGTLNYGLAPARARGMLGGDTEPKITDYILGILDEASGPTSIQVVDDMEVLRKEFIISKAVLEILNKVLRRSRSESLRRLEITAKKDAVALTPDLLENPYLEVKGDRSQGSATWKYSPAFLVKLEVLIKFELVEELLSALLNGQAEVKLGGQDARKVDLFTVLKSVRLLKDLPDATQADIGTIEVRLADVEGLTEAERESKINEIKRRAVEGLTQPIAMTVEVYVLDFVPPEEATKLLEPKKDSGKGKPAASPKGR